MTRIFAFLIAALFVLAGAGHAQAQDLIKDLIKVSAKATRKISTRISIQA